MWINFKSGLIEFENSLYCIIPQKVVEKENLAESEELIVKILPKND